MPYGRQRAKMYVAASPGGMLGGNGLLGNIGDLFGANNITGGTVTADAEGNPVYTPAEGHGGIFGRAGQRRADELNTQMYPLVYQMLAEKAAQAAKQKNDLERVGVENANTRSLREMIHGHTLSEQAAAALDAQKLQEIVNASREKIANLEAYAPYARDAGINPINPPDASLDANKLKIAQAIAAQRAGLTATPEWFQAANEQELAKLRKDSMFNVPEGTIAVNLGKSDPSVLTGNTQATQTRMNQFNMPETFHSFTPGGIPLQMPPGNLNEAIGTANQAASKFGGGINAAPAGGNLSLVQQPIGVQQFQFPDDGVVAPLNDQGKQKSTIKAAPGVGDLLPPNNQTPAFLRKLDDVTDSLGNSVGDYFYQQWLRGGNVLSNAWQGLGAGQDYKPGYKASF